MQEVQDIMLVEVQGRFRVVQGRCREVQRGAGGLHHLHLSKRLSIISVCREVQVVQAHLRLK